MTTILSLVFCHREKGEETERAHHLRLLGSPWRISRMRAWVLSLIPVGSASLAKKRCSAISREGGGTLDCFQCLNEEHDVIARQHVEIGIDAKQLRLTREQYT